MKTVLFVIGLLVVCTAFLMTFIVSLFRCNPACNAFDGLRPYLMLMTPLVYAVCALLYLQARRRRAAVDPAWVAKARRAGPRAAIVLSIVLLAGGTLVLTCFGLTFWWPR